MLEPDAIVSLIGALRPPLGYRLDFAVGTTFTLDLNALLMAPAAFAKFEIDDAAEDDRTPVGLLESVRRHADRMLVFCQSGQIVVPQTRTLVPLLEQSVARVEVPGGLFHPKIWVLRFEDVESGQQRHRLLCLSRNLTTDRSRDTIVRLDSDERGSLLGDDVGVFLRGLPPMAINRMGDDRVGMVNTLADELTSTRFRTPAGVDVVRFHILGMEGANDRLPFPQAAHRSLVISPFLGKGGGLKRLPISANSSLVSRPAEIDRAGPAVEVFENVYVLNPDSVADPEMPDEPLSAGDPAQPETGLHAKLYAFDVGDQAHLFTGSANATEAAFGSNVEAMIELIGDARAIGVAQIMREPPKGETGFIELLMRYAPGDEPDEESEDVLDVARRSLASARFVAEIDRSETGYLMRCIAADVLPLDPGTRLAMWPLTSAAFRQEPVIEDGELSVTFEIEKVTEITSFLVLELRNDEQVSRTVVTAQLVGDPEGRRGRLIIELLGDANRFLKYLLFLLAGENADPFDLIEAGESDAPGDGVGSEAHLGIPLLETMLRAVHDEPTRLENVERLLRDLDDVDDRDKMLPEGFWGIWAPLLEAARRVRQ